MSQELTPERQAKAEQMFPFWRFHMWHKGHGSYDQIEEKTRRGELPLFFCPDEGCDCAWPKPSHAADSSSLERMIPFDSDEAARLTTVTGWVSRNGHFYGDDERTARYDGCTHKPCEDCGDLIRRDSLTVCQPCLSKRDAARFAEMPRKEWDGATPLVIFNTDTYFFGEDDLDEYCEEHDVTRESLPLVLCVPQRGRRVDALDLLEDVLAEDASEYDIPTPILDAVELLNKAIEAAGAFSWTQGKYAAQFGATGQ